MSGILIVSVFSRPKVGRRDPNPDLSDEDEELQRVLALSMQEGRGQHHMSMQEGRGQHHMDTHHR